MSTTRRVADQDDIRNILSSKLRNNIGGLKLSKLVECIRQVVSKTKEEDIKEVLDKIATVSEGKYVLKQESNVDSPISSEGGSSSDSDSSSGSASNSSSDSSSGSASGSDSDSSSGTDKGKCPNLMHKSDGRSSDSKSDSNGGEKTIPKSNCNSDDSSDSHSLNKNSKVLKSGSGSGNKKSKGQHDNDSDKKESKGKMNTDFDKKKPIGKKVIEKSDNASGSKSGSDSGISEDSGSKSSSESGKTSGNDSGSKSGNDSGSSDNSGSKSSSESGKTSGSDTGSKSGSDKSESMKEKEDEDLDVDIGGIDVNSDSKSGTDESESKKRKQDEDVDVDIGGINHTESDSKSASDESESKKQKQDEDVDVNVDVGVSESEKQKEDKNMDVDLGVKSDSDIGSDSKSGSDESEFKKQKEDEDVDVSNESESKKQKEDEDVDADVASEKEDMKMRNYKTLSIESAMDDTQKSEGDDDDNIEDWLMEIDADDEKMVDDEDLPPDETIDPSYYDPYFKSAKHKVELILDNEMYVTPSARKYGGSKRIGTSSDTRLRKKRPLEESTNFNRDSEATRMQGPKKPKLAMVQEGPILGKDRFHKDPPKQEPIQAKALKFKDEPKKQEATKTVPVKFKIAEVSKKQEATKEGVITFEMPELLKKQKAKEGKGSTNGAMEPESLLGKRKQPKEPFEMASKDQNKQGNKCSFSLKETSKESETRPGKAKKTQFSTEYVSKEQIKLGTKLNVSSRAPSKESVKEPVLAKDLQAQSKNVLREQKKPFMGEVASKAACKEPDITKPVQAKQPQLSIPKSSEEQKKQATKGEASSKGDPMQSGNTEPRQSKQSLASVDKAWRVQKKPQSKGKVSCKEASKESTDTRSDDQHKLTHSQPSITQPTKEQRKVTKEEVSSKRVASKDSGTESDPEKHRAAPIQKPKSTKESSIAKNKSGKISNGSSLGLSKYIPSTRDDNHEQDQFRASSSIKDKNYGSVGGKFLYPKSLYVDDLVPMELDNGEGGTASAKAEEAEHPPGMKWRNPNQRNPHGHIKEAQRGADVQRDKNIQQKMGRTSIKVDDVNLVQNQNNIHDEKKIKVIRTRKDAEVIKGPISNEEAMKDREPPEEGRSQTSDANAPHHAEETGKDNDTALEEGEISDTEQNDIISDELSKSHGNRNEETKKLPSYINTLTAMQKTEERDYKHFQNEVPQQWKPVNNLKMYKEYVDLYEERHTCYMSIRKTLEKIIDEFKKLKQKLDKAKHEKNRNLLKQVTRAIRKKHAEVENIYCERKKTYMVLHKELDNLRGHILRFYEAHCTTMDTSMPSLLPH